MILTQHLPPDDSLITFDWLLYELDGRFYRVLGSGNTRIPMYSLRLEGDSNIFIRFISPISLFDKDTNIFLLRLTAEKEYKYEVSRQGTHIIISDDIKLALTPTSCALL